MPLDRVCSSFLPLCFKQKIQFRADILIRVYNFVRVDPNYKHDVNLFVLHVFKSKD